MLYHSMEGIAGHTFDECTTNAASCYLRNNSGTGLSTITSFRTAPFGKLGNVDSENSAISPLMYEGG